jgi:hypothetical protein
VTEPSRRSEARRVQPRIVSRKRDEGFLHVRSGAGGVVRGSARQDRPAAANGAAGCKRQAVVFCSVRIADDPPGGLAPRARRCESLGRSTGQTERIKEEAREAATIVASDLSHSDDVCSVCGKRAGQTIAGTIPKAEPAGEAGRVPLSSHAIPSRNAVSPDRRLPTPSAS